jgi:hypothetical protein
MNMVCVDIVYVSFFQLLDGLGSVDIDVTMLERSEETLDGDVVDGSAFIEIILRY